MKGRVKILVDMAMYVLMVYLLGYRAGSGLLHHGVYGCVLFGLFVLHHVLNVKWYRGLGRGRYPLGRVLFVGTDMVLLGGMGLMAVSAVMMSGDVFAASPFTVTQRARDLHNLGTSWGFVLMGIHLGFHTRGFLGKAYRTVKETIFAYVYDLVFLLVLAAGIYCFFRSGIWRNMFLISNENMAFAPLKFYGECVMTTVGACQAVWVVTVLGKTFGRRKISHKGRYKRDSESTSYRKGENL